MWGWVAALSPIYLTLAASAVAAFVVDHRIAHPRGK